MTPFRLTCAACGHADDVPDDPAQSVYTCSECRARTAFGVLMARVTHLPHSDRRFVVAQFEHGQGEKRVEVSFAFDREYGAEIALDLLSVCDRRRRPLHVWRAVSVQEWGVLGLHRSRSRLMIQVAARGTLAGLELLEAGIIQAIGLTMRSGIQAAEASAKGTTLWKDKSGGTRGSIRGELQGFASGFVIAGGASRFLESGTRPHVIVGKPVLRFVVNGQTLFRRMVHHPGTAERPFMTEARRIGEQAVAYGAEYFVGEAIRRAR